MNASDCAPYGNAALPLIRKNGPNRLTKWDLIKILAAGGTAYSQQAVQVKKEILA
jgi:hypothetical protein